MSLKFKRFILTIIWLTKRLKILKNRYFDKKYELARGYIIFKLIKTFISFLKQG